MKTLSKIAACILLLSCLVNPAHAQDLEKQLMKSRTDCGDVFINAMDLLPPLYREKEYDSIQYVVGLWEKTCGATMESAIITLLVSMEENTFYLSAYDSSFILLLNDYASKFQNRNLYGDTYIAAMQTYFQITSTWAKLYRESKVPAPTEDFICTVLAGEIKNPEQAIRDNSETYPELMAFVQSLDKEKRSGLRTNLAFMGGVWIPTGNLSLLGAHPSIGFQAGIRDKHNQLDLTVQFRFIESANPYVIERYGSYYVRETYFGGYIGLDYSYYFATSQKTDFGITLGVGYDGFDVAEYYDDYLDPTTIGSFNANGGFKLNYFVGPSFYIGLQAKYNWINYGNPNGTNLNGDAYTIDLIFGFNGKSYSRF